MFVLVGATATLTAYIVLIVMVEVWQVNAVVAFVIGYLIGNVVNYNLNCHFLSQSEQLHCIVLPQFLTVMVIGLVLNFVIIHADENRIDLDYVLAQLAAMAMLLMWRYVANRLWAFAD